MSRAWIAFYMGDYDKDTQALSTLEHGAYFLLLKHCWIHGSIPLEAAKRANIVRLSLREWKKVAPAIDPFFDHEGCNKRATREIEKAEIVRMKRQIAGQRGGYASGISKAKQIGSKLIANATANLKQTGQQIPKPSVANHDSKITTTFSEAARDPSSSPAGELATALPPGALRSPDQKQTISASPELQAIFARKQ